MIHQTDFEAFLASWQIPSTSGGQQVMAPPTPILLGQARCIGSAARIAGGTQLTQKQLATQLSVANPNQQPTQQGSQTGAQPSSATKSATKIKLSTVVSQVAVDEVEVLDETVITMGFARYKSIFGEAPEEDMEPTIEQYTALHDMLIIRKVCPYVDFSVWGPNWIRNQKRNKLRGFFLDGDGNVAKHELLDLQTLVNGTSVMKFW